MSARPCRPTLKLKLDGNDAAVEAQQRFMQNQHAENGRASTPASTPSWCG